MSADGQDAIVIRGLVKSFKKTSRRKEITTLKSELVRALTFQKREAEPPQLIQALRGIDLRIPRGKTVGIVGRNGSGKSTLLKLVTGIYTPTSGTIEVHGRISALLELGAGFHPDFTGRENILINGIILGMSRAEVKARVEQIIEYAELGDFIDEPVRTYSSGMFMRLAFAVATHVDPEILIIDEILSVGDEHFARKSYAKMNEFRHGGKTILLVTHGLSTVETWCDLAAWIDGGRIRMFGEPRQVVAEYRRAIAAAEAEAEKTGTSALSAPGLALPQTAPAAAPAVSTRLTAVRLQDVAGAAPATFTAEGGVTVLLDYDVSPRALARFGVDVMSADGRLVFSLGHDAGELEGKGTVRLSLPRLGLADGVYEVLGTITRPGDPPAPPHRVALSVTGGAKAGVLRPVHEWKVERSS
ncbi:MAG: polysaccharide ABC transporter ATP-binding protein [Myxococcota bacterium]